MKERKTTGSIINAIDRGEKVLCDKCHKGYWRAIAPGWKFNHGYECDNPDCDAYIEVCGPTLETIEEWEK